MFEKLKFLPSLASDNHSGVHPKVMRALSAANRGAAHAYGLDEVSALVRGEFRRTFGPTVEPHLVFTGTAANVLSLAAGQRSFHATICSSVAHLHDSECAAPEKFTGGKLWTIPSRDGRITPTQAAALLERRGDQHCAQPRWVSLTQPTEFGVVYSLEELRTWGEFCRDKRLMLHIDGARLANAAAHLGCSLEAVTAGIGADAVSFGGTKNGLMGAEAVLLFRPELNENFKFLRKQAMQLPSKTRFLAAQFYAYLEGDLWLDLARAVNARARSLRDQLADFPEVRVVHAVESNALFVELPEAWLKPLREHVFFYVWDRRRRLVRWLISWDWREADTADLVAELARLRALTKTTPPA